MVSINGQISVYSSRRQVLARKAGPWLLYWWLFSWVFLVLQPCCEALAAVVPHDHPYDHPSVSMETTGGDAHKFHGEGISAAHSHCDQHAVDDQAVGSVVAVLPKNSLSLENTVLLPSSLPSPPLVVAASVFQNSRPNLQTWPSIPLYLRFLRFLE